MNNSTYQTTCPEFMIIYFPAILLVLSFVAILSNCYLLISSQWIRTSLSLNLALSLSLAATDSWAGLLNCVNLVLNSVMPKFWHQQALAVPNCIRVVLEVLRIASFSTSVLHLLALSINHLLGIRYPFQRWQFERKRFIRASILILWFLPIVGFMFPIFVVPDQGLHDPRNKCQSSFMVKFEFRVTVFCILFVPFAIILVMYGIIFRLICKSKNKNTYSLTIHRKENHDQQRSLNTISTALMILGTFAVGWIPSIILYLLVCNDGCPIKYIQCPTGTILFFVVNLLLIGKLFANPLIYGLRIGEIKCALWLMHVTCFGYRYPPEDWRKRMPKEFGRLMRNSLSVSVRAKRKLDGRQSDQGSRRQNSSRSKGPNCPVVFQSAQPNNDPLKSEMVNLSTDNVNIDKLSMPSTKSSRRHISFADEDDSLL